MKSQIGQWGNSLGLRTPKYAVEALDLKPNNAIECTVEAGKLNVQRIQTLPEFTLDELLASITEEPEGEARGLSFSAPTEHESLKHIPQDGSSI
jgi:antitoxin MazE